MLDFVQPLSDDFNDILFVRGERNGNYPFSHSLLIEDYLIDTGISSNRLNRLRKEYPINNVLLSHWHEDHISGNHLLPNSKFLCHAKDRVPVEDIEKILPYYNVENTDAGTEFSAILGYYGMKDTQINECFNDNTLINIGDYLKLKVVFTPGHTAGHCDLTRFPYYATIDSNLIEFENSIEKLKTLKIEIAVAGHRDPVVGSSNVKADLDNFKSVIQKRDERILSNLSEKKPIYLNDLKGMNLIYRRYNFEIFEIISELVMIEKHFDKFLKEETVAIKDDGYILN
jgi:ribonuclease BN (tRNA processing enzyme)